MIELKIKGVTANPAGHYQVVWLADLEDNLCFPFLTGADEASSICTGLMGTRGRKASMHEVIGELIERSDVRLLRVNMLEAPGDEISPEVVFAVDGAEFRFATKLSDALAMALRCDAPIYLSEVLLARAARAGNFAMNLELTYEGEPEARYSEEAVGAAIDALLAKVGFPGDSPQNKRMGLERALERAIRLENYREAARIKGEIDRLIRDEDPV